MRLLYNSAGWSVGLCWSVSRSMSPGGLRHLSAPMAGQRRKRAGTAPRHQALKSNILSMAAAAALLSPSTSLLQRRIDVGSTMRVPGVATCREVNGDFAACGLAPPLAGTQG